MIWTWSTSSEFHSGSNSVFANPRDKKVCTLSLPKIVVDAEDLLFVEDGADRVVDGLCRREVVSIGFLEHDAR